MNLIRVAIVTIIVLIAQNSFGYLEVEQEVGSKTFYVLYDEVLLDNSKYEVLIEKLNNAVKGDIVYIVIESNRGGAVPTMNIIKKAMLNSKAIVDVTVVGFAASAGAVLSFQGDIVRFKPGVRFLFHTGAICFGPDLCERVAPFFLQSPMFANIYKNSIKFNKFIYKKKTSYYFFGRQITMPWITDLVDADYWEYLKTGQDAWVTGGEMCVNKTGFLGKMHMELSGNCILQGEK